jgi:predicted lactoylglutathione lyase
MTQPRFGSVNVVVQDVDAAARFLTALGVALEPTLPDWSAHHRSFEADVSAFDADLDSPSFARWWGGVPADLVPGVVVNLLVDGREEVDALHQRAIELGATELKPPWDAFWGSRYAVVLAPGPLCLGLMNEPDGSRRTPPPTVGAFTD